MIVGFCAEGTAPKLPGWLLPVTGQEKKTPPDTCGSSSFANKRLAGFELKGT